MMTSTETPTVRTRTCSRLMAVVLPLALSLAACQGTISDKGQPAGGGNGNGNGNGSGSGNDPIDTTQTTAQLCAKLGPTLHVGWTRLRRLTRAEYNHTVRDLLGIADTNPAGAISPDEQIGPFFSNAIAPITDLIVQQHQEAAAKLAVTATSSMAKIAGCDLTADTNDTCAKSFIGQFGQ